MKNKKTALYIFAKWFAWRVLCIRPYWVFVFWKPGRDPVSIHTDVVIKNGISSIVRWDGIKKDLAHKWAFTHLSITGKKVIY